MIESCEHLEKIGEVTPSSPDSCNKCVDAGDKWVQLRICLHCGHVGCCDNSKNTHATKHFEESGHCVIQTYQPGMGWRYCYDHEDGLPDAKPFR
jgi:uncharacterized UBP type Zn finger protein